MHSSMTVPQQAARTARSPAGAGKAAGALKSAGAVTPVTSAAHRMPSGSAGRRSAETALRPSRIPPVPSAADRALDIVASHRGRALDGQLRSTTEGLLGGDFSGVRVHTHADAARSALALGASAYTIGDDIVFAPGAYAPTTPEGFSTLIHELVHVRQQRQGAGSPAGADGSVAVSDPGDRLEREAEAIARQPLGGQPITRAPQQAIQRCGAHPCPPAGCGTAHDAEVTPGRGGIFRKLLQRQVTATPPGPKLPDCKNLLGQIKQAVAELISRAADLVSDPLGLQWHNWSKSNPKIMPDGTNLGSVEGHQEQYEGWRNRLRNRVSDWDDDDCNSTGLRVPDDARQLVFKPAPVPIPRAEPGTGPKPWEPPGAHRVATLAKGAAIGAGAGLVLGGVLGAVIGGAGGTLVAPGVGTVGGGGLGAVAGAELGASAGAAVGTAVGALYGWLTGD
jgi:Domain of unknown function (DUF4157)